MLGRLRGSVQCLSIDGQSVSRARCWKHVLLVALAASLCVWIQGAAFIALSVLVSPPGGMWVMVPCVIVVICWPLMNLLSPKSATCATVEPQHSASDDS